MDACMNLFLKCLNINLMKTKVQWWLLPSSRRIWLFGLSFMLAEFFSVVIVVASTMPSISC
ncbi:hypothetical protein QQP08_020554 [Theobroma cacao]|nr:hypothetical protein QQP08_020554 [Theobroma cacao]